MVNSCIINKIFIILMSIPLELNGGYDKKTTLF